MKRRLIMKGKAEGKLSLKKEACKKKGVERNKEKNSKGG